MRTFNNQSSMPIGRRSDWRWGRSQNFTALGFLVLALSATGMFTENANAGVGCDLNVRVNNHMNHSIMVYGASGSSASKSGMNLWSPLTGMADVTLGDENSGAGSHSKQAVELELPCWTGKVDFKIKYLDGSTQKWTRRDGVSIKSGDTIQININN